MTDPFQRRTAIVLLAAVNGAAVSAFANPIFMNPGASAVTFALLAALVAVCRNAPVGDGRRSRLMWKRFTDGALLPPLVMTLDAVAFRVGPLLMRAGRRPGPRLGNGAGVCAGRGQHR